MKAILINPEDKTVKVIDIEQNNDAIYKAIDCETFACPITYDNGDTMYCDDEGLFIPQKGGIMMHDWAYPILGKILILGSDEDGNSVDVKSDIGFFVKQISWWSEQAAEEYRKRYN